MGTLVAKAYPTQLFANAADHTYVECGTGAKGWGCWGGKAGGRVLRQASGSTLRADRIAQPNERARVTCYLVNGVCHQAANRILMPAGIMVTGARGYGVSRGMYGPYGRVGFFPCNASWNRHVGVVGDLPACVPPPAPLVPESDSGAGDEPEDAAEVARQTRYMETVLAMYDSADDLAGLESTDGDGASEFHAELFRVTVDFELGETVTDRERSNLDEIRARTESRQVALGVAWSREEVPPSELVEQTNALTLDFQGEMANALSEVQYEALFGLTRDEPVVLADPAIIAEIYGG